MSLTNKNKDFLTLKQQVDRLSFKYHLLIKDKAKAKEYLLYRNYFDLINGLEDLFLSQNTKKNSKDFSGYSLENFVTFYDINVDFRTFSLKIIAEYETKLRSLIAYYFNESLYRQANTPYDVLAYIDGSNFICPNQVTDPDLYEIKNNFDLFKNKQNVPRSYNHLVDPTSPLSIRLYKNVYMANKMDKRNLFHDFDIPPFWVAIKEFDFGDLIKFISLCKNGIVKEVKSAMGFSDFTRQEFIAALFAIKNLRNHMAHAQMLNRFHNSPKYNFETNIKIVGDVRENGDSISVFEIFTIISKAVKIDPLSNPLRQINKLISSEKKLEIIAIEFLRTMGNEKINEWFDLLSTE